MILSRIGFAFLLASLSFSFVVQADFSDVSGNDTYHDAVDFVKAQGIVQGYNDGTFRPDQGINRAEFTKIIIAARFNNINCSTSDFSDVNPQDWFAPFVCQAKQQDIITGFPDGTFRPGAPIKFVEAAKIIGQTFNITSAAESTIWFEPFVRGLSQRKAIPNAITSFEKTISRGEMAEMIYRIQANVTNKDSKSYERLAGLPEPVAPTPASPVPAEPAIAPEPEPVVVRRDFANGTFTAQGSYRSPGGSDTIEVTAVIKDDLLTDISVEKVIASRVSTGYIERFARNIGNEVIGQPIKGLTSPSRVSGSSLTSRGFNAALETIRTEASQN